MADQDEKAVRRCLEGETDAFETLVARYEARVYSLLLRLVGNPTDAEDLAQETFVKAYRKLETWEAGRPFLSWLFKIAHNTALDFLRARRPEHQTLDDPEQPVDVAERAPAEPEIDAGSVERALAELPPLYREALLLRHHEELDYAEIARITGAPLGTVKIRIFRGRELLRRRLAETFGTVGT